MEVACTAKRNFDRECKKTFATKSARSRHSQNGRHIGACWRAVLLFDHVGSHHNRVHEPASGNKRTIGPRVKLGRRYEGGEGAPGFMRDNCEHSHLLTRELAASS